MLRPTEFHLALEAVVAYVDGELSPGATQRARAHLDGCSECAGDVAAQREAKSLLVGSAGPQLPGTLLSRLNDIPFSADLQAPPMSLAMDGDHLRWNAGGSPPGTGRDGRPLPPGRQQAVVGPAPGALVPATDDRPPGRPDLPGPPNRRSGLSTLRMRRLRRGLVGAVAGLAVGVLAATVAPAAVTSGVAAAPVRSSPATRDPVPVANALFGPLSESMLPHFRGAASGIR